MEQSHPPGQGAEAGWLSPPKRQLPVRSQSERLPACSIKEQCLPARQKRRSLGLSIYYPLHLRAQERNQTPAYRREMARRRTIVEGIFASLDRLGWAKSRLRGLWKVDCEGFMASFAHKVLKAVRRLGSGTGPPEPDGSGGYAQFQSPVSSGDRCPVVLTPAW